MSIWERSRRWRVSDWLDSPLSWSPALSSLLCRFSWSLCWRLFLASNSKSNFTNLYIRSISQSLSLCRSCSMAPDTVWSVWYNPSPRPDCSSSRLRSLSSRLFYLHSHHVDLWEDPMDLLSVWSPECPSDIFPLLESLPNHNFVGDPYRRCQLRIPNVGPLG